MRTLGIDIGTTSISAVVIDSKMCRAEKSYTIENNSFLKTAHPWEKLQDPEEILQKVLGLLQQIRKECEDIQAIGLTGQMHGMVYVNENGEHVSPLYTWQDQRGSIPFRDGKSLCEILKETQGVEVSTGYGLVTHIYQTLMGQVPGQAVSICSIMDYIGMILTKRRTPLVHTSNAAGFGFFDVERGCFRESLLEKAGVSGRILPEVTREVVSLGSYQGIPVYTAIGDNQASFLGAVEDAENSVLVNIGTGAQVSVCSDSFMQAEEIEIRPYLGNHYLLVGSSLCGGRAYALLESFFRQYGEALGIGNVDHYAVMEQILKSGSHAGEKLRVDTRFAGTRSYPEGRGSIQNIGVDNFTPQALIEGVLEGMADELFTFYQKMEKGEAQARTKIIGSGNGIRRNRYLQRIMSKKFNMEVQVCRHTEEAALGAALSCSYGKERNVDDLF